MVLNCNIFIKKFGECGTKVCILTRFGSCGRTSNSSDDVKHKQVGSVHLGQLIMRMVVGV